MTDLTLTDNIFLFALSIFMFIYRLPVNSSDKIYLFVTIFFPSAIFLIFLNYFLGMDFKVFSLGR